MSVAQVVERLCPTAVAQLGDPERCAKLDAAVTESGWRELRTGNDDGSPLASGVESALVAEELGRGAVDTPFVGPVLAAELRRLAGVTPWPLASRPWPSTRSCRCSASPWTAPRWRRSASMPPGARWPCWPSRRARATGWPRSSWVRRRPDRT